MRVSLPSLVVLLLCLVSSAHSSSSSSSSSSFPRRRRRSRYLLQDHTEADALHHRSLYVPPKEDHDGGTSNSEKTEKNTNTKTNSDNAEDKTPTAREWRGAETKTLAKLLELEEKYSEMMRNFREGQNKASLSELDRIGDEYRKASREHHEELERAKKMLLARENSSSNSSNDNTGADVNDPVTREQFFKA